MNRSASIMLALALAALSSCATYRQTIEFKPLSLDLPASASRSLRLGGATIAKDGFAVKKEFSFTKIAIAPLLSTGAIALELKPELDAIVLEAGANAIVELRIKLIGINDSAAHSVRATRCLGIMMAVMGGGVSLYSYALSGLAEPGLDALGPSSAGFGLVGGAVFALSYLQEKNASIKYAYEISGKAVKIIN